MSIDWDTNEDTSLIILDNFLHLKKNSEIQLSLLYGKYEFLKTS